MRRRNGGGTGLAQRWAAWAGFALMIVSLVFLQGLPRNEFTFGRAAAPEEARGPVRCVILDAGHGGQDSGAIQGSVQEKDLTLDVALRVDRILRAKGVKTVLTRVSDEAISLAKRAATANQESDSVFVSIHFDEGGRSAATGVQTFYAVHQVPKESFAGTWLPFLQKVSSVSDNLESQSLAGLVQEALVFRTQAVNRGIRAEQFYVIANVRHPAVLVEGGFLTNTGDLAKLTTDAYREQVASAIVAGIMRYRDAVGQQKAVVAAGEPRT